MLPPRRRTTARSLVPLLASVASAALLAALVPAASTATAAPADLAERADRSDTAARADRVTPVRLVTANINFGLKPPGERKQVAHVLASRPDVVALQETREINLRRPGGTVARLDDYRIVQFWDAGPYQRASSILVRKSRFTLVDSGLAPGYSGVSGVDQPRARYLPWAIVADKKTRLRFAVISVHMPIKSRTNANYRRAYRQMLGNYEALVAKLGRNGRQVLTGGDWNQATERNDHRIDYDPVDSNKRAGLALNWSYGDACGATHGTSKIDALAWKRGTVTLIGQRCLTRAGSDHRPVLADIQIHG